ncbi:hypothetical protein [Peribacillus loiseleuriae]|uniref:Uncharacterized protein n=1 Tax=Peribacillus loiseleuriae TaxID=1679170 RepID=A0A0K9GVY6_9BACI|nr:hypothetical protein [Peribacillus loiseleuriae]KMY50412.1 hypothetical protein AC625_13620 [Peribacillus loiseleuriae]
MEKDQSIPTQNLEHPPSNTNIVSVKSWLGTLALLLIPIVNIILLFVWAFDGEFNVNRKNFAKAQLILMAIIIGLYLIIFVFFLVLVGITANY